MRWIKRILLILPLLLVNNANAYTQLPVSETYLQAIEVTPSGILTGEFDTRSWLHPYNGIRLSKDLGETWEDNGLEGKKITDIKYYKGKVYASVYNQTTTPRGIFILQEDGTWEQSGPDISTSSVSRNDSTIFMGGYSHGLWKSDDEGETWTQSIGDGWSGPEIKKIEVMENNIYVLTNNTLMESKDNGNTWEETSFENTYPKDIKATNEYIIVATGLSNKIFEKHHSESNWKEISLQKENLYPTNIQIFGNHIFIIGTLNSTVVIIHSQNNGITWTALDTIPTINKVLDTSILFGYPLKLLICISGQQPYVIEVPDWEDEIDMQLSTPWETEDKMELIDRITAYFDHSFPLLGYSLHKEPYEESSTTLNYLGNKDKEPTLYYSSHNGIDFGLKYGSDILATSGGTASLYSCTDCGYSVKVSHPEGYQTIYMHLQKERLGGMENIIVSKGDTIGKVGMTGKTSGPHLHLSTYFDKNNNGTFEYPDELLDPFGSDRDSIDPWKAYAWTDSQGEHQGTQSKYLWTQEPSIIKETINETKEITLDNKSIHIPYQLETPTFFHIANIAGGIIKNQIKDLVYVPNTGIEISLKDQIGKEIKELSSMAKISIQLVPETLSNIDLNTLGIYYWEEQEEYWVKLSSILDPITNMIEAFTEHFSKFAVLGNPNEQETPLETDITIQGNLQDFYYTTPITITLTSNKPNSRIFYSLRNDEWDEYLHPIEVNNQGITVFKYRAMDEIENLEETQQRIFVINLDGKWTKNIRIENTYFEITPPPSTSSPL